MSNTKVYGDVVATVGEYKDKDGNEKKRFLRVGTAFINEDDKGKSRCLSRWMHYR